MAISLPVYARARSLTGFVEVVSSRGGDVGALLESVGLDADVLTRPDAVIAFGPGAALLDRAAETLELPDIGLRLGDYQDMSVLGPVALTARYAADVREALHALVRHMPYHTPGTQLTVDTDTAAGVTSLHCGLPGFDGPPSRHVVELSYVIACKVLRLIAQDAGADWQVNLPHSAGVSPARYRKAYGCTVCFEQPFDALMFPSELLDVKIDQANDELRRKAERYINDVVQRFPLDIGKQTSALVDRHLATGHFSLRDIARQLGLHERTLQRRLSEQNMVFEEIVDQIRRERASEYVQSSAIPLIQVATFLGYSNQTAFTRACRRWFGDSPQTLRRRQSRSGGRRGT
jgi:AraC-like DNA-binding protein